MSSITPTFEQIHADFRPKVFRFLVGMVGEAEAEDLTQEVFLRVSRALETFRGEAQLSTWIYRIATNAALDRLRTPAFKIHELPASASGGCSGEIDEDAFAVAVVSNCNAWTGEPAPAVEGQIVRREAHDCFRVYVDELLPNYRAVFVLCDLEGLKNQEAAEILGISLHTVKIRLHRARQRLKQELTARCEAYWFEGSDFLPEIKVITLGSS